MNKKPKVKDISIEIMIAIEKELYGKKKEVKK